jgi:hypothetical protein
MTAWILLMIFISTNDWSGNNGEIETRNVVMNKQI